MVGLCSRAAWHHDDVRPRHVGQRVVDVELQPTAAGDDPAGSLRGEHDLSAGQADEHLVGTYRVQQGELVVENYRDLHACLLRLLMNCPSAAAGCAESAPVL